MTIPVGRMSKEDMQWMQDAIDIVERAGYKVTSPRQEKLFAMRWVHHWTAEKAAQTMIKSIQNQAAGIRGKGL